MKSLVLALSLSAAAFLSACADLKDAFRADAGATGTEEQRPYPKSASDLGLF